MKTIVAPIDFSAASQQVVAEAVDLARALRARLIVMHVVQPPVITDSDVGARMSADYAAMASESAAKQLSALQKKLQLRGITIETRHVTGSPGRSIVDLAGALDASYVVLGSHGHGAIYDLVIGSTTTRVLKHAPCPVVVVPGGRKKKAKR